MANLKEGAFWQLFGRGLPLHCVVRDFPPRASFGACIPLGTQRPQQGVHWATKVMICNVFLIETRVMTFVAHCTAEIRSHVTLVKHLRRRGF